MLKSLKINNFRCFKQFELQQLGRVNLLVGTNNSGKTSILEAIQLLSPQMNLELLQEIIMSRGEYILIDKPSLRSLRNELIELDICHLFYGHKIDIDSYFSVFAENDANNQEKITFSIVQTEQLNLFEHLQELILLIEWLGQEKNNIELRLSPNQCLSLANNKPIRSDFKNSGIKTQFIKSSSLTTETMIELFDQLVLTPEEELITEALQCIEPNIKRIASLGSDRYRYGRYSNSHSGFVVRLTDSDQRIPIGSMGDGIWRMLGLTLAMVNAKNGVLLVDEIDTGLHFTTMFDMWKLIWETSKRLNIQVFATTHNSDCWTSLATIASQENSSKDGITIHRIEKGKSSSTIFNERQIVIAAERGIEVR